MMIKKFLFAAGLLSLVLASGCAKGGSGPCVNNCPAVVVDDSQQIVAGLNLSIAFTATVTGTSQTAVNWSITGASCSGSGSPCGTLTNVTTSSATYNAPSAVPTSPTVTVVAALQSDSTVSGSQDLTIIPDTANVTPATQVNIGLGLTQQFAATAVPDQAPQTFTWSCVANSVACVNFTPGANGAGTAIYTPVISEECGLNCVQISAVATVDPTGCQTPSFTCASPKLNVVASRVSGTYAFQFSGFDTSLKPVNAAGTFTADPNTGVITGVEDVYTSAGPTQYAISGGSYVPNTSDPNNSNNAGKLNLTGGALSQFLVVLDGAGDLQMIESDSNGTGSGVAESTSRNQFFQGVNQAFVFGFTGVDFSAPLPNRVGYVGLLPTDGNGNVTTGATMDVNDNGNTSNICGSSPCNLGGSYTYDQPSNVGHLILTSAVTMHFDFFVASGKAPNGNNNPLTIYAISTDPIDAVHPAVVGTLVFQNSSPSPDSKYDNAAFNGASVSALIGANANVSLTLANTDGKGGFAGQFDQNNGGTEISDPPTTPFAYTYAASGTSGRYSFQMLGNPATKAPPLPFVLYASAGNRGFLLDQSSPAVITGTMNPSQGPKQNLGNFSNSLLTGTFAVATSSSSVSNIAPLTMNLLLTFTGNGATSVVGTENPGNQPVTGSYDVKSAGYGTITLTSPKADYIIYAVDTTHFYAIRDASKDSGATSPMLFMAQ